jgi:hypothetical protein
MTWKKVRQIIAALIHAPRFKREADDFARKARKMRGEVAKAWIMKRLREAPEIRDARIKRQRRSSRYRSKRQNKSVGTIYDAHYFAAIPHGRIYTLALARASGAFAPKKLDCLALNGFIFEPAPDREKAIDQLLEELQRA